VRYLSSSGVNTKDTATVLKHDIDQVKKNKKKIHKNFVSLNFYRFFKPILTLYIFRLGRIY
jgi:hypothetical protein